MSNIENTLIKLKYILNSYSDKELKEMDLWINNSNQVEVIGVDNNSISLILDSKLLQIDGKEW